MKYFLLLLFFFFSVNNNLLSKEFTKIEKTEFIIIHYMPFSFRSFCDLDCNDLKISSEPLIKEKRITEKDKIISLVNKLKFARKTKILHPNFRIRVDFYFNGKIKNTLCFDNFNMHFNGKAIQYSCEIRREILKLCDYWNEFPNERKMNCDK